MESKLDNKLFGSVTLRSLITFALSVLTFAVISWLFFYPNDINGDVLRQSDTLQGLANGHETQLYEQSTGEHSRWTDALFGGMPTFQISPSYKGTSMLKWAENLYHLYFPTPVSWLFVLMLGFFILMLAFNVKWYLAVLGAVGYGFSSYFLILVGAGHIWKLLTLAYIPPTLAGIVWCYRGKYLGGAAVAAFFGALQLASNHVQMTYYSLFVIVAMVIACLVKAIRDKKLGRWGIATGALAVAAVLALAANSPNLMLTYKYSQETIRGGHSELTPAPGDDKAAAVQASNDGLDKDYITQWSYGIGETMTLLVPNAKGGATILPQHGENVLLSLAQTHKAEQMAGNGELGPQAGQALSQFPQYFGDQPMTNGPVYVGALIFALFLLGCAVVKGPMKWALLAATVISVLLSWGHNFMGLTGWMIDNFPMYNKFRTVSSILVIAEITIPILAVLALKEVFTQKDFFAKHGVAVWVSFSVCLLLCLLLWLFPGIMGSYSAQETEQMVQSGMLQQVPDVDAAVRAVRGALVSADACRSLLVLLLGLAALVLFKLGKMNATVTGLVVAGIVLADMYIVDKRYINEGSFVSGFDVETPQGFTPRPADTQILQDKDPNYRVLDLQRFGEAMPSYFHKTVGGYHAAKLTRYNDLIERQITQNNIQVLNMLNTRYIIVDDNTVQRNPSALGNAWWVDSLTYVKTADEEMAFLNDFNPARHAVADAKFEKSLGQAVAKQPGDTIYETSYAPNCLTYKSHSAKGGLAVFSEVYFPWGWTVDIDGKPAEMGRVNYVLRGLQVPAGDHTITFTFKPEVVTKSENTASVAVIVIYLALLAALNFHIFCRKKKDEATAGTDNETPKPAQSKKSK